MRTACLQRRIFILPSSSHAVSIAFVPQLDLRHRDDVATGRGSNFCARARTALRRARRCG
jgi:hypothetical protein